MSEFEDAFVINSTACFYALLAFLPLLDARNSSEKSLTRETRIKSQFIATSSIGTFSRRPGMGFAYAASKAAVIHMVKQMAMYLAPYHVRCNTFCPGIYPSVMSQEMMGTADLTKEGTILQDIVPATRVGTEEDVAGAMLFLAVAPVSGIVRAI
ncbi:NAD(P)-binding protein [Glonium stellatum]|uniref:NAD(P)-binding protein n=1 Tax=Glonium stellatum TaxID=574774 RepID=A0A8E2F1B8_9PEZI|nr:NAD(P)-binding protein [Glonium stellatum]